MRHEISLSRSISLKTSIEMANMDRTPYASMIEFIMYVMLCTKHDIVHALGVMSRNQADLGLEH